MATSKSAVQSRSAEPSWSIAELAREFEVTPRTIRFYEDEGLISPLRDGTRRIYRPRDRTRLRLILRGKRIGFPLKDIKEIIELFDRPPGERAQLRLLLDKIEQRRAELEQKRRDILASLEELDGVAQSCHQRLGELDKAGAAS